jgi:capsular exopolysaccharide synthesis family protein
MNRSHWLFLLRHRWPTVIVLWTLAVAAGAAYNATAPRLYLAEATVEIGPEAPLLTAQDAASQTSSAQMWDRYFKTQSEILRSRSLHERALKALPPERRAEFEAQKDPAEAVGRRVQVAAQERTLILRVGFLHADPRAATEIANAVTRAYVTEATGRFGEVSAVRAGRLAQQILPELRTAVEEADKKLQQFQKDNGFPVFDEQYKTKLALVNQLEQRLAAVKVRRLEVEARAEALKSAMSGGAMTGLPSDLADHRILSEMLLQRGALQDQLARDLVDLRPEHPNILGLRAQIARMDERIKETAKGILKGFEIELEGKKAEERGLGNELAEGQKRAGELSAKVTQYRQLDSELTAARDIYNAYLKRYSENVAVSGTPLASIRILDYASVPGRPATPNTVLNLAICLVAGLLLGLLGAAAVDELDNKIRSGEEIEAALGLGVLATVPTMKGHGAGDGPILLPQAAAGTELEPFRKLRIEVMTRLQRLNGGKVLCVVSALKGEGKTTTAVNLARTMALQGHRVLLVDADLRQPSALKALKMSAAVDLVDYLRGKKDIVPTQTTIPNVHVVGTAAGAADASELAGSSRFHDMIQLMRPGYDAIVIDSPPAALSSEAGVLAQRSDAALLVVRERWTRRNAAIAVRRRLEALDVKFVGVVVNAARGRESDYGYYAYGAQQGAPAQAEQPVQAS